MEKVIKDTFKASNANEAKQAKSGKTTVDKENAALVKAAKKPKSTTHHKPTKAQLEAINVAVRKAIGKGVAVEGTIGTRYSDGPQGAPYLRYILSNNHTVFVSGWHSDKLHVSVSQKVLDPKSWSGKNYYAKQARAEARIAKARASAKEVK